MRLVRHGQSEWNVSFGAWRIDAGIPDPSLTALGREQARLAGERLAPHGITRVIASPYSRTVETAEIIAKQLGVDISVEPLVRERCAFSCDQGKPPGDLAQRWPGIDFSALENVWWGGAIESANSIKQRCQRFFEATQHLADRESVAVISHWGFIRAATGRMVENAEIVHWPADPA